MTILLPSSMALRLLRKSFVNGRNRQHGYFLTHRRYLAHRRRYVLCPRLILDGWSNGWKNTHRQGLSNIRRFRHQIIVDSFLLVFFFSFLIFFALSRAFPQFFDSSKTPNYPEGLLCAIFALWCVLRAVGQMVDASKPMFRLSPDGLFFQCSIVRLLLTCGCWRVSRMVWLGAWTWGFISSSRELVVAIPLR